MPISNYFIKEQDATEKALLTASLNLFLIHDENNISVTQLAKAAGVSKATFYKHFSNKEDLYSAILLMDELELTPVLRKLMRSGSIAELLKAYLNYRIQHLDRYRVLIRLEKKLENSCKAVRFLQWQQLRKHHITDFNAIVESKMSNEQAANSQDFQFYYGFIWTITSGLAHLSESDFYHELISDRRGYAKFLLDMINTIGETND